VDGGGLGTAAIELDRTLMDARGSQARGLQNRLRAWQTKGRRARPLLMREQLPDDVSELLLLARFSGALG
jgi:hypothetical protein